MIKIGKENIEKRKKLRRESCHERNKSAMNEKCRNRDREREIERKCKEKNMLYE